MQIYFWMNRNQSVFCLWFRNHLNINTALQTRILTMALIKIWMQWRWLFHWNSSLNLIKLVLSVSINSYGSLQYKIKEIIKSQWQWHVFVEILIKFYVVWFPWKKNGEQWLNLPSLQHAYPIKIVKFYRGES